MPDANKIKYGIKNVYFWEYNVSDAGVVSFGTPYHAVSAVSATPSQDSSFEDIPADDTIWWTDAIDGPDTIEMTFVRLEDEFKKRFCGYVNTTDGGLALPINPKKQALCMVIEFEGDKHNNRLVYYNGICGPITREFETTSRESKNVKNDVVSIRFIGDAASGLIKNTYKPTDSGYNSLFTSPQPPVVASTSTSNSTS